MWQAKYASAVTKNLGLIFQPPRGDCMYFLLHVKKIQWVKFVTQICYRKERAPVIGLNDPRILARIPSLAFFPSWVGTDSSGFDFRPCSEGYFLIGCPQSVLSTNSDKKDRVQSYKELSPIGPLLYRVYCFSLSKASRHSPFFNVNRFVFEWSFIAK